MVRRGLAGFEKTAEAEGRTSIWVDEAGFYLIPGRVRTYAPRGETPELRVFQTRDHLSAISGITPDGRLFFRAQVDAFRGPTVVAFLQQLTRQVPGRLLVLWDGAPIHRAQPVKDFLQTPAGRRIRLVRLPAYAPETNPDEGIWQYLKRVELRNLCCGDQEELRAELQLGVRRLRRKSHLIQGCFRHAGYSL